MSALVSGEIYFVFALVEFEPNLKILFDGGNDGT